MKRTTINGVPVDSVDRQKVTDGKKEEIAENVDAGDLKEALNGLLEVVSGETKEEILGGDS